jgi:mannose-6-phosphate isomerase-like protein (cupin superfamily)
VTTPTCTDRGGEIGLEVHEHGDQFLRVESERARREIGPKPAGTWRNVVNIGDGPLKVYALYAPPEHAHGTVHATKSEPDAVEHA